MRSTLLPQVPEAQRWVSCPLTWGCLAWRCHAQRLIAEVQHAAEE